jgi:hypothetical protein
VITFGTVVMNANNLIIINDNNRLDYIINIFVALKWITQ